MFSFRTQFPEEASLPKVFPLGATRKPAGMSAFSSKRDFARNFSVFTEDMLTCKLVFFKRECVDGS
jgi:hypothetical protein